MTAKPRARRALRAVGPAVVAIALLASAFGGAATAESSASPSSIPCPGDRLPSNYTGSLALDGGALSPSAVGGVAITYGYLVQLVVHLDSGGLPLYRCVSYSGSATTDAAGDFAFAPAIPATVCVSGPDGYCIDYSGPYGPVSATTAGHPPAGYALSIGQTRTHFDLTFVWELSTLTVTPAGSQFVVPPNDPVTFAATGWMANGSVTPLSPDFAWTLDGVGWSFAGPPLGNSSAVIAVPGASVATLTVEASVVVDGTVLAPPPVTATLVAVATSLEGGELNRTTVDAGASVGAQFNAIGAAGYSYAATIAPGLGLPEVVAECGTSPDEPGTVFVSCATNLSYPEPGVAQPTANLTNGFSSATWFFPNVTIEPPPRLSVSPRDPTGYVGRPLSIDVSAAPGSGAAPYAKACLGVDGAAPTCDSTAGPTWSFSRTFAAAGAFGAIAWAIDADGTNRSVAFPVQIVAPLALGPIGLDGGNASAGEPVGLAVSMAGGELPARFWWNESGVAGPLLSGTVNSDGSLSLTFVPASAGSTEVSLAVSDSLGMVETVDRIVDVGPSPVAFVAPVTVPPAAAVFVGTSVPVAWEAFDRSGTPVRSFGAPAELFLTGSDASAVTLWVNASGTGALTRSAEGGYAIPSSAWVGGVLNLSVTPATAGAFGLELGGSELPGAVAPVPFLATADADHVVLYDPTVESVSARAGATHWLVRDRYGNPAPGAVLTVRSDWGGLSSVALLVAIAASNGTSGVWINYSAPTSTGGTLTVFDAAGAVLLGPIEVPSVPAGSAPAAIVVLLGAIGTGGIGGAAVLLRRRRSPRGAEPPAGEEELRRLAEGRSAVVEIVGRHGAIDLRGLESRWEPPPAPPDLADWIASLVADGTLGASMGPDGTARFCLAREREGAPRVTVDTEAYDEAMGRREEALRDDDDRPPQGASGAGARRPKA